MLEVVENVVRCLYGLAHGRNVHQYRCDRHAQEEAGFLLLAHSPDLFCFSLNLHFPKGRIFCDVALAFLFVSVVSR